VTPEQPEARGPPALLVHKALLEQPARKV